MTRHVIYLNPSQSEATEEPAWRRALGESDFSVLRTTTPEQAISYIKNYPITGVLIDLDGEPEWSAEALGKIAGLEETRRMPLLGVTERTLGADEQAGLSEAGYRGLVSPATAPSFLIFQLESFQTINDLKRFEETGMTAKTLAHETRKLIHDLSQPLSALQGRLQLLSAKCPDDDPLKERYASLVEMVIEVARHTREIQQVSRKYTE